jgi:hypothetical protein
MWLVAGNAAAWAAPPMLAVERTDGGCRLTYVTNDAEITRPFWMNLKTLTGREVTRPRPLRPDDLDDHAAMHPGVWIAFGDVNGHDDWRLKTGVRHAGYASGPAIEDGAFEMAVQNEYLMEAGDPFMRETARWRARVVEDAWLLSVVTKFETIDETPAVFGDQEEMGLGVRLAKSIAEKTSDGTVRDSEGRSGAEDVWGHSAAWCDYSGSPSMLRQAISDPAGGTCGTPG